ncbi:9939_t:CDS:2, partial [Entrophospora sp. SA101]
MALDHAKNQKNQSINLLLPSPTYNFECFFNLLIYGHPISPSSESQLIEKTSFPEQLTVGVEETSTNNEKVPMK